MIVPAWIIEETENTISLVFGSEPEILTAKSQLIDKSTIKMIERSGHIFMKAEFCIVVFNENKAPQTLKDMIKK
jgi:hypothetical protein